MAQFKAGDTVKVNHVYASKWEELDGSEKHVRDHLGTVKRFTDNFIEVKPLNPVLGGWGSPYLFWPEELDLVEAHPLTN